MDITTNDIFISIIIALLILFSVVYIHESVHANICVKHGFDVLEFSILPPYVKCNITKEKVCENPENFIKYIEENNEWDKAWYGGFEGKNEALEMFVELYKSGELDEICKDVKK